MALEILETYPVNVEVGRGKKEHHQFGVPEGGPWSLLAEKVCKVVLGADKVRIFELSARFRINATEPQVLAAIGSGSVEVGGIKLQLPCRVGLDRGESADFLPERRITLGVIGQAKVGLTEPIGFQISTESGGRIGSFSLPQISTPQARLRLILEPDQSVGSECRVTDINRVGIRLDSGYAGVHASGLSRPILPGTVQINPASELLIHGPDGATIGGYPVVGQVIAADREVLASLHPGVPVEIETVTREMAIELLDQKMQSEARLLESFEAAMDLWRKTLPGLI